MKTAVAILFSLLSLIAQAQFIERTIQSFGALGNGVANDQEAFEKAAAFFNARGGEGRLLIPAGQYRVGKQVKNKSSADRNFIEGIDVLALSGVHNLEIIGDSGTVITYEQGLLYGSFHPRRLVPYAAPKHFYDRRYAASLGTAIHITNSSNVVIKKIEINGNNTVLRYGGGFGDVGTQLAHYGLLITNSRNLAIEQVNIHHMALDGISIANQKSKQADSIVILQSNFKFNGRQGLSWIGGNFLVVKNCEFGHTGRIAISSAPGAGVDLEAEVGPVQNGWFQNCVFTNNTGPGLLAESGDVSSMQFDSCQFEGNSAWAAWINKPNFQFTQCQFMGSVVHGFDASTSMEATRFKHCLFTDEVQNQQNAASKFLFETSGRRRVQFDSCTFLANYQKLVWMDGSKNWNSQEQYQLNSCRFILNHNRLANGDFALVLRQVNYKNCQFNIPKNYYIETSTQNTDGGGNRGHRN